MDTFANQKVSAVIVFDINGVLADVRKKHMPVIPEGLYPLQNVFEMPNGQMVYLRPNILLFLQQTFTFLRNNNIMVGIWTSRLERNAIPIIDWIVDELNKLQHPNDKYLNFDFVLTGEHCKTLYDSSHAARNNVPILIKSINTLRQTLKTKITQETKVLFLDDNPDYLELDSSSWFFRFNTYDAYKAVRALHLERDATMIYKNQDVMRAWMESIESEGRYVLSRKEVVMQWYANVCCRR
jgi:hypothetical protein